MATHVTVLCAGVYGELLQADQVWIRNAALSDTHVGVFILMGGSASLDFVRRPQRSNITDSLIVGRSSAYDCSSSSFPGLHACQHYMAWCYHLGVERFGVVMSNFMSGANMAPKVHPWDAVDSYPALLGGMHVESVTFARFGEVSHLLHVCVMDSCVCVFDTFSRRSF